jgi:transposase-like protein
MIKLCDNCDSSFNVFNEGNVSNYGVTLCGNCWIVESRSRGINSLMNGGIK